MADTNWSELGRVLDKIRLLQQGMAEDGVPRYSAKDIAEFQELLKQGLSMTPPCAEHIWDEIGNWFLLQHTRTREYAYEKVWEELHFEFSMGKYMIRLQRMKSGTTLEGYAAEYAKSQMTIEGWFRIREW